MKIQLVLVACLIPSMAFAEVSRCRDANRQKLLDFWSEQTKDANHCETADQCFFLDRGSGYHVQAKDAVRLGTCFGFAYSKAKSECFRGEGGVGGNQEFFEFKRAENPSGYACIKGACIPQYAKPARRWARELRNMTISRQKKSDEPVDENCWTQVNALFP